MNLETLKAAVDEAFVLTGADTPGWPAPRPRRAPPDVDDYSKLTNVAKYRILGTRIEAWGRALEALGLATVTVTTPGPDDWPRTSELHEPDRVIRVWPVRDAAVSIHAELHDFDGVPDAGLTLGAGEPAKSVALIPNCGCDACDHGSADLLRELDRYLIEAIEDCPTDHGHRNLRGPAWF